MNPHIYNPHADDVIVPTDQAGDQPAGDQAGDQAGAKKPPEPTTGVPLMLAIAREETLVYRGHIARLVELWDAVRMMGLVCADQTKVPDLLAHVEFLRSIGRK